MRFRSIFSMFLLSIFIAACSTTPDKPRPNPPPGKYMSHEEVVDDFLKQTEEVPDEGIDLRKAQLVPMNIFATEDDKIRLQKVSARYKRKQKAKGKADLRAKDTPVKRQWNGTCTTFGGVAGLENLMNINVDMSERDSWSKYQQYSSSAFVRALSKTSNAICEEKYWKQSAGTPSSLCKNNRRYYLKSNRYIGDDLNDMMEALDNGHPVYLAMVTPKDMLNCRKTIRASTDYANGGHAILIVGYRLDNRIAGGGYLMIKNSWGSRCGDKGYQYMAFGVREEIDYMSMWEFMEVGDTK